MVLPIKVIPRSLELFAAPALHDRYDPREGIRTAISSKQKPETVGRKFTGLNAKAQAFGSDPFVANHIQARGPGNGR